MTLICPDCRGELQQPAGSRTAQCPLHGGTYEVLFDRAGESSAVKPVERVVEGKACDAHPRQRAVADCASCGKALCGLCSFDVAGRHYCSDCAVSGAQAPPPPPPPRPVLSTPFNSADSLTGYAAPPPLEQPRFTPTVTPGLKCSQHLDVDAVAECRGCSSGVCATCDFEMPGGVHFCPACIDNAGSEEISPKRKKLAVVALVIAAYVTFMFFFMLTGAFYRAMGSPKDLQVLGCFVLLIVYAPSIVGTALASNAFKRRFRNTPVIWIALVWNVVVLAVLGIQLIFGMMRA
ncbi:MAG TPA: hypothetical protein VN181_03645 [Thermoanaerobaculia bacterium]|nr:hypothetical protein [Thermoanaerobaculia bacterium]